MDSNHWSRRQQIYSLPPLATRELSHMELVMGLEPATCWLQISCSTNWATPAFCLQRLVCNVYIYMICRHRTLSANIIRFIHNTFCFAKPAPGCFALLFASQTQQPPPCLLWMLTFLLRKKVLGGSYRARTCDILLVRQTLSQLS